MYFTAETQAHILRRFHFGLDDDGYLLLGKSEMLIAHTDLFAPVELKRRAFRKVIKPTRRDRVRVMANNTARRMFSLGRNDFGRPLRDLELSYRPVELRSHLDTLDRELRSIELRPSTGRAAKAIVLSTSASSRSSRTARRWARASPTST